VPEADRLVLAGVGVPARIGSLPLPVTGAEVAQFVGVRAAACVGADYSNLAWLADGGDSLRLFHGTFLSLEIAERYTDVPLSAPYPIAVAARSGAEVLLPDLDAYRVRFPEIVADTVAAGVQATASLPLFRADGTPVGAIGFAWTKATTFDTKLESALRAVAELCTATIEHAERHDADRRFIVELSVSLLGELPVVAGLEAAARYLPSNHTLAVGGDWYEGIVLDGQRLALVVGDVTGHGPAAFADMALLRGMITALLHSGVAVGDVFGDVSTFLLQRPGLLLATAALVVVDLADNAVEYATAGHPPPLVQLPTGEVRRLDQANAPMLGCTSTKLVAGSMPFPLGSRLVMYTDGLVERRDRPFDVGIDQLTATLSSLAQGAAASYVADAVLDAVLDRGPSKDDVAIVVVHHVS
jgi:hypothetical protein